MSIDMERAVLTPHRADGVDVERLDQVARCLEPERRVVISARDHHCQIGPPLLESS